MLFPLKNAGRLRAKQLADEIKTGTGLVVTVEGMAAPDCDQVIIEGDALKENFAAIEKITSAHEPGTDYFPAEKRMKSRQSAVKTIAQSAVGGALTELTAAQRNALMACLLFKAEALTDDLKIKPLSDWLR